MTKAKSKRLLGFSLTIVLLLSATGCHTPNAGSTGESNPTAQTVESAGRETTGKFLLPDIEADYWEVFDARCDVVFEPGFSLMSGIDLTLLSAVPLEQSDVTVTLPAGLETNYWLNPYNGEDGKYYLNEDLFLLYQGVSAEDLLAYHSGGLSGERTAEINEWLFAYRALDDSEKPAVYRYTLDLFIPDPYMDSETVLNEITVAVKGKSRTCQLGVVQSRIMEAIEYEYDPDSRLNCNDNIGYSGYSAEVSKEGVILLKDIRYTAENNLIITGIRFLKGEDVQIQRVTVVQNTADGAVIDTAWDMKQPIELNSGDSIYLNVQIADPFFAGTLGGWNARYLMLEYQCDGETFELGIPFIFVQSLHDPFAYIAAEDGLDVLTYYSH